MQGVKSKNTQTMRSDCFPVKLHFFLEENKIILMELNRKSDQNVGWRNSKAHRKIIF